MGRWRWPGAALLLSLLAIWACAPGLCSASESDEATAATTARKATKLCRDRKPDKAAAALRELAGQLTVVLGAEHSATQLVRMKISQLEPDDAAGELHGLTPTQVSPSEEAAETAIGPKLARALRGLRICSTLAVPSRQGKRPKPSHKSDISTQLAEEPLQVQLEAAGRLAAKGRYQDALEIAVSASRLAVESDDVQLRMRANETLALIRLQLGDSAGAQAAARLAAADAAKAHAPLARISMARLLTQVGDLEGAGEALDEAAESSHTLRVAAELEEARGDLQIRLGSPSRAIAHLERALAGHRGIFGEEHASTAAVLQLLGDAARLAGDFPTATTTYARALEIRRSVLPKRHPDIARTRNAIGVLRADFGDWVGADRAFAQALAALESQLGGQHPETLTIRANRSLMAWGAENSAQNASSYEQAVLELGTVLGLVHPIATAASRNLARMWMDLGQLDRARALIERVLTSQRESLGESHPALALTRLALADLLTRAGKLEEAWHESSLATNLILAAYRKDHPSVARARLAAAQIALLRGDTARAWTESKESARIVELHLRRSFGAMSDRQRAAAARDTTKVVNSVLSVPGVSAQETYLTLLPQRDSVLRSIAAQRTSAAPRDPATRAMLDKLAGLRGRYAAAVLGGNPELTGRVHELAVEIDSLQSRVALAENRQGQRAPLDVLLAACVHLPKDAALVEFIAFDRYSQSAGQPPRAEYAAIVVRGSGCQVQRVDLGPAEPIDDVAERFSARMRDQLSDAPEERRELSERLLAPLQHALAGTSRWLVVPDAVLWGVPLGALPDPLAPDHYLLERVTLGYLTSIYELAVPREFSTTDPLKRALLFGGPDFGKGSKGGGPVVLTATGPCRIPPFEPLPSAVLELQEVGELLAESRIISGGDATKTRLQQELKNSPEILHLATHAYFAGQGECAQATTAKSELAGAGPIATNPLLLSGIVLAGANRDAQLGADASSQRNSGILTAFEAASLDLHSTRLVVLSACDTGTGLHQRGQEVQGLRWGFRAAGAGALLTSLWRSNDFATRTLMQRFYRALASPDLSRDVFRGAEALRVAQLYNVGREQRLGIKKPLVWANFVMSGVL